LSTVYFCLDDEYYRRNFLPTNNFYRRIVTFLLQYRGFFTHFINNDKLYGQTSKSSQRTVSKIKGGFVTYLVPCTH